MKKPQVFRRIAETVLIYSAQIIIPVLPRWGVLGLARGLSRLGYAFAPRLRNVALANLAVAFGDEKSPQEREQIARECYLTCCLVLLDIFWFGMFSEKRLKRYVSFESSYQYYVDARPAIVATAHFGNWEIMGQAAALDGNPSASVAASFENPAVNKALNRLRGSTGQMVHDKSGVIRTLLKTLRNGDRVALLIDQNTVPTDGGEFVDFFGLPVPVTKAVGWLSERTDADIVVTYCTGDRRGHYRIHALPPFKARAVLAEGKNVTQAAVSRLEQVIREYPGQWNWMYKRWKYYPEDMPPGQYPFYSKSISEVTGGKP